MAPSHDGARERGASSPLPPEGITHRRRRPSLGWLLVFTGAWWLLAHPATDAWVAGALAVGGAVLLHTALGESGPFRLRARGALGFVPYFAMLAVRGGLDVSRRAFAPDLPLAPDLLAYGIRLPEGPPRTFFVNCVSLLPGTFSADLEGRDLTVHVLARDTTGEARLRRLEAKVSELFGLELDPESSPP